MAPATKIDRNDPVIVGFIHNLETIMNTQNNFAITDFNNRLTNYNQQLTQFTWDDPRPKPVKPQPPVIQTLDEEKVVAILEAYYNRDMNARNPDGTLAADGALDLEPAYGHDTYDPHNPVPPVVSINPVGAIIIGKPTRRTLAAKFAEPGPNQIQMGDRRLGPDGLLYELVDSGSPFNRTGEWEQVKGA